MDRVKPWCEVCADAVGAQEATERRKLEAEVARLRAALDILAPLAVEAADALWAIAHHKQPRRDPISVNQAIYSTLRQQSEQGVKPAAW